MKMNVCRHGSHMWRPAVLLVLVAAAMIVTILPCGAQDDMDVVDNEMFARPARPPALFAHDEHNDMAGIDDCAICHHVYENGQRVENATSEDQRCVECHGLAANEENGIPLRRAFHLRCKGCHMAADAGPVMCAECHPRPLD